MTQTDTSFEMTTLAAGWRVDYRRAREELGKLVIRPNSKVQASSSQIQIRMGKRTLGFIFSNSNNSTG